MNTLKLLLMIMAFQVSDSIKAMLAQTIDDLSSSLGSDYKKDQYPYRALENTSYFVINLERRADRLEHFRHHLPPGLSEEKINHIAAYDGHDLGAFTAEEESLFKEADFLNQPNARVIMGCYLSHLYVMKHIVQNKIPFSVVFEDDVVFSDNFVFYMEHLLADLPSDGEIIFLGHIFGIAGKRNNGDYFYKAKDPNPWVGTFIDLVNPTTQAYLITLQGAMNFLEFVSSCVNQKKCVRPIDGNLNDYLRRKNIFYGTYINLVNQNMTLWSDIGNVYERRDFTKVGKYI